MGDINKIKDMVNKRNVKSLVLDVDTLDVEMHYITLHGAVKNKRTDMHWAQFKLKSIDLRNFDFFCEKKNLRVLRV